MTKIQNSKPVSVIWYWNLRFVCNLVLGVWDFMDSSTPTSSFWGVTTSIGNLKMLRLNPVTIQ